MAPIGPQGYGWQDEAPTVSLRPLRPGPLGVTHARQLRWHPVARVAWWLFLLPLAIFAWSSWRLRGLPRAFGYVVAGFVLLFGVGLVSAPPPPPPATVAAPAPLAAAASPTTPAAPATPVVPVRPVYTPAPPPAPAIPVTTTTRPAPIARRAAPPSTYTTPPRPRTTARVPSAASASGDTYTNVDGNQVQRPVAGARPAGATAKCRDGSWSSSQHRSGTCSGHGGVAEWL
jgi:hypothetical protein